MVYCTVASANAVCKWLDVFQIDGGSINEPYDPHADQAPGSMPSGDRIAQWLTDTAHNEGISCAYLLDRIRKYGPLQAAVMTKDELEAEKAAADWPAGWQLPTPAEAKEQLSKIGKEQAR